MIPTPTEKVLIEEYRVERKRLLERLKHIEGWMAQFTSTNGMAPKATGSNAEEEMPRTIRTAIRQYLQAQKEPQFAPEIAQAMVKEGFFPTYKQTKSNVDSALGRMAANGEIEKDEKGFWIKKTNSTAA